MLRRTVRRTQVLLSLRVGQRTHPAGLAHPYFISPMSLKRVK